MHISEVSTETWSAYIADLLHRIKNAQTLEELEALEIEAFGSKKGRKDGNRRHTDNPRE